MSSKLDGTSPMQSKKFWAYLVSELTSKCIMAWIITHLGTLEFYEVVLLLTMIVSSSALTIGYIIGQSSLDKYLHSAVEIFDREDQELKKELAKMKVEQGDEEK